MELKVGDKVRLKNDSRKIAVTIIKIFDKDLSKMDKYGNIEYLTIKGQLQVEFNNISGENYKSTLSRSQIEKIN